MPFELVTFIIALDLVVIYQAININIDIRLGDEGYLWYGVTRMGYKEVPIRDFKAYDPARYYWCYAWSKIFGNSLLGLRRANAAFLVIGIWASLLCISRYTHNWWLHILVGTLLLIWSYPRHKYFEHTITLASILTMLILLQEPASDKYLLAGLFIGLAAFFGRNHGLYNTIAYSAAILFLWRQGDQPAFQDIFNFIVGIFIGYSPMLLMWAFIPGLFKNWMKLNLGIVNRGKANLSIPILWPWKVKLENRDFENYFLTLSTSIFFILLPVFYVTVIIWAFTSKAITSEYYLVIASSFVGFPYLHHLFSRADIGHLAQSIHPFLLGLTGFLFIPNQSNIAALLIMFTILLTVFCTPKILPIVRRLKYKRGYTAYNLNGEVFWIGKSLAITLKTLRDFADKNIKPTENIFIPSIHSALYVILKKPTPVYDIFPTHPVDEIAQQEVIQDLETKEVNWALIITQILNDRPDRQYQFSHPHVWEYFTTHFAPIEFEGLPPHYQLYQRKN